MYSLRQGWQALTHSHQMADSNAADQEKLLKTLEKRAAEAEQRLSALENGSQETGASPEVIQTLQSVRQLLSKAQERQLELEKREAALVKESTQNKSKLTVLQEKNSKLEYQILHLKRAVKDGDAALNAAQMQ